MRGISPFTFKEQRKRQGAFRCAECDCVYPLGLQVEQDGRKICSVTCQRSMGVQDIARANAEAAAEAARTDGQYELDPVRSLFAGQQLIYSINDNEPVHYTLPAPFQVNPPNDPLIITGLNLDTSLTFTVPDAAGDNFLEISDISADGDEALLGWGFDDDLIQPGDYDLYCPELRDYPIRKAFFIVRSSNSDGGGGGPE